MEFHWLEHHEKAFSDVKQLLLTPGTLKYYDMLSAALSQDQGPVAYASKAMNETLTTVCTD